MHEYTKNIIQIPKAAVNLLYNGKDCSEDFSKYLNSVSFREYEDEQSDELSISLNNNDGYFTDSWYPEKGAKLTCKIIYGTETFDCGTLAINENSFHFSTSGDTVEIKALATSTNFPVRTQKVINHSGKTLNQIASAIGEIHNFKVLGTDGNVRVGTVVQKNESDISFLKRIAKQYGFIFNIKDGFLTFIKTEELETSESLFALNKTDINSLTLNDTVSKIYGKCSVQYLDLKTKTLKTYTANGNTNISDTLKLYKRCGSLEEAKRFAESALKNGSREITGTIKPKTPLKNFMPGVNFEISGIKRYDGKYHIKSTTLNVSSSGFTQEGEISKC